MKFFIYLLTILLGLNLKLGAQTVKGTLRNLAGNSIEIANILIKSEQNSSSISEFVIAREGEYSISLKKEYVNHILVEVKALGYITKSEVINNPQKNQIYTINFILIEDEKKLEEIVIKAPKNPIQVKEDTVSYDVASFSDGSEKKIEEIIKKLPGIKVNLKTGAITYKGQPIETVMLDGINLFDYNYTLGTKNISVNMVSQIEAIENYSENHLLKGIEQGGKVALNLKLKKGKFEFSANLDSGIGIENNGNGVFNSNNILLGITQAYKTFATISFNNLGLNNSPFSYYGEGLTSEDIKEKEFYFDKIISEDISLSNIEQSNGVINNAWFGNFNIAFKPKKYLSIKSNLYYLNDLITSRYLSESNNIIANQAFSTSDLQIASKKPVQYRGDVEVKINTSTTSLIEYDTRVSEENIMIAADVFINSQNTLQSKLNTDNFYSKQKILFTKRISAKQAIQTSFLYSKNIVHQNLQLSPSILDSVNFQIDLQSNSNNKRILSSEVTLLGASKKGQYVLTLGAQENRSESISNLSSRNNDNGEALTVSENNLKYSLKSLYNLGSYRLILGKWNFMPSYSLRLLHQNLDNRLKNNQLTKASFIFEPSLNIRYLLSPHSSINSVSGYQQRINADKHSFAEPILINSRNLINNTPNLNLQKTFFSNIFYSYINLYDQTILNLRVSYQKEAGSFSSNLVVQPNFTRTTYFYLPQNTENTSVDFTFEKYIAFLEFNVKLNSNYTLLRYNNILNNSTLRSNSTNTFSNSLSIQTAFDTPINFNNTIDFSVVYSSSANRETFNNKALSNTTEILLSISKKVFFTLSSRFILPSISKLTQNLLFLDSRVRFLPKNKKYEFDFIINNILNLENFVQIETNDFSTNLYKTNLLPRYFLTSLTYSF